MLSKALAAASQIPAHDVRKAAIQLASAFEGIILADHPDGQGVFGCERDLNARHGASPKAIRQALRILESRFLGTVRRGVNGGLALRVPDMAQTAELMAIYLSAIGAGLADSVQAQQILAGPLAPRPAAPRRFVDGLLAALAAIFAQAGTPGGAMPRGATGTRALLIARRIVSRHAGAAGAAPRLGRLSDLEQEHSSGRPVILQAIRILEEFEMIEMIPGRGGGIALRTPSPGAIVRAIYPHFALQGLSLEMARDIIWSLNQAHAMQAAAIRTPAQADGLRAVLDDLDRHVRETGDHSAQVLIWRMLGDIVGNQVLHMLARCTFYFQMQRDSAIRDHVVAPLTAAMRLPTALVARAVCDGDAEGAGAAVLACEQVARAG